MLTISYRTFLFVYQKCNRYFLEVQNIHTVIRQKNIISLKNCKCYGCNSRFYYMATSKLTFIIFLFQIMQVKVHTKTLGFGQHAILKSGEESLRSYWKSQLQGGGN